MGPSMIVDGKGALVPTVLGGVAGFNGAVDDRRRKGFAARYHVHVRLASMGPSMIVDGKTSANAVAAPLAVLQWGRR